jgi:hypothetical protein
MIQIKIIRIVDSKKLHILFRKFEVFKTASLL